jgi:hypothetical protein
MAKTRLFLTNSLNKAIDKVTAQMTPELIRAAISDGWEPTDASSLRVEHRPSVITGTNKVSKFTARIVTEGGSKSEYGTQGESPKGTVRKFMHNTRPWEKTTAKIWERETFKGGRK